MSSETQCGSLHKVPVGVIADRCARLILACAAPRAVTLDPEGRVWVEPPREVAESDLVGVYTREPGLLELSRRLMEDLRHERDVRGLTPQRRRMVVRPRVATGRAA